MGNLGLLRGALGFRRFEEIHSLVKLLGNDVPIVQERVLLEPDIDECGLEPGLQVFDAALEHAGDDSRLGRPLDAELFELAVFEHGDPVLQRLGVDDDFLEDSFFTASGEQFFTLFQYLFDRVHG